MFRKRKYFLIGFIMLVSAGSSIAAADYNKLPLSSPDVQAVYRVYNPNSGEHFYTTDSKERAILISLGWSDESIGWYAPASGDPVYRLYNHNAGDHYYTQSASERDSLVAIGWSDEGTSWNSGGDTAVYVSYNANAKTGTHNFTTDQNEQNNLLSIGWKYGKTTWEAVAQGVPEKGTLPETLPGAVPMSISVEESINEMQELVVSKGQVSLGTRVILFYGNFTMPDGVYEKGDMVSITMNDGAELEAPEVSNVPVDELPGFYSSRYYPVNTNPHARVTAVLTVDGWYLLPDFSSVEADGTFKMPDLDKFIQTGNPDDLTSYIDGSPLTYTENEQFGRAIKISQ